RPLHAGGAVRRDRRPAPGLAHVPRTRGDRAERGQPPDALRAGGLRARVPDAGGRHRDLLPDLRILGARAGAGRALERPDLRDRVARGPAHDHRARRALSGLPAGRGRRAMTLDELRAELKATALGDELAAWIAELYPICRSITGDGVRETLRRLQ